MDGAETAVPEFGGGGEGVGGAAEDGVGETPLRVVKRGCAVVREFPVEEDGDGDN